MEGGAELWRCHFPERSLEMSWWQCTSVAPKNSHRKWQDGRHLGAERFNSTESGEALKPRFRCGTTGTGEPKSRRTSMPGKWKWFCVILSSEIEKGMHLNRVRKARWRFLAGGAATELRRKEIECNIWGLHFHQAAGSLSLSVILLAVHGFEKMENVPWRFWHRC